MQQPKSNRLKMFFLLWTIYLSYIALGLPEGALGLAWPIIRIEMDLPLEMVGIFAVVFSIFYVLTSSQNGMISKYLKTEKMNLLGIFLLVISYFVFSVTPNFAVMAVMTVFVGIGMGLIDTGLNDYMSKHFSSRHMNWMHCFWGMGAAFSPIIMSQMILLFGWRMGYVSIASLQAVIGVVVLFSIIKGVWNREQKQNDTDETDVPAKSAKIYLTSKSAVFLQMLLFFLYAGTEGSLGFWISSVLIESRGFSVEAASVFPATYFACIMAGRAIFGFVAGKASNVVLIRIGMVLAAIGIVILIFSNNVIGMAFAGLGFAPLFPCLMHETSNRFSSGTLSKLVGYQIAAAGSGGAFFSIMVGLSLSRIYIESLFPIVFTLAAVVLLLNEILAAKLRKASC